MNGIPNTIYHYTSLQTLEAIVTNKTLRLSDITKSNDSEEIVWIERYITDIFEDVYVRNRTRRLEELLPKDRWMALTEHYKTDYFDGDHRYYSYYVICFSTEMDLLSQWRGYGDDGRGVAIGLNTEVLIQALHRVSPALSLGKVRYDARSQEAAVRRLAQSLIKAIKDEIASIIPSDIDDSEDYRNIVRSVYMPWFNAAFGALFDQAVTMKNPFFQEEREYRVYMQVSNGDILQTNHDSLDKDPNVISPLDSFHYFTRGNNISSYLDIPVERYMISSSHPLIQSVCIGPRCDVSKKEIQYMLKQNGIPSMSRNFQIEKSKGTYQRRKMG